MMLAWPLRTVFTWTPSFTMLMMRRCWWRKVYFQGLNGVSCDGNAYKAYLTGLIVWTVAHGTLRTSHTSPTLVPRSVFNIFSKNSFLISRGRPSSTLAPGLAQCSTAPTISAKPARLSASRSTKTFANCKRTQWPSSSWRTGWRSFWATCALRRSCWSPQTWSSWTMSSPGSCRNNCRWGPALCWCFWISHYSASSGQDVAVLAQSDQARLPPCHHPRLGGQPHPLEDRHQDRVLGQADGWLRAHWRGWWADGTLRDQALRSFAQKQLARERRYLHLRESRYGKIHSFFSESELWRA